MGRGIMWAFCVAGGLLDWVVSALYAWLSRRMTALESRICSHTHDIVISRGLDHTIQQLQFGAAGPGEQAICLYDLPSTHTTSPPHPLPHLPRPSHISRLPRPPLPTNPNPPSESHHPMSQTLRTSINNSSSKLAPSPLQPAPPLHFTSLHVTPLTVTFCAGPGKEDPCAGILGDVSRVVRPGRYS